MADTDYSQTIIGYYQNILGRTPDASEVAVWNSRLQSGDATLSGLAHTFATSPEAQAYSQPVAELYQSLLGRSPDQAGLQHWTAQYKAAVTGGTDSHTALASIAQQFFQSPETQALYGSNGSTAADVTQSAVTKLYENALGREPGTLANGTSEVQYWVDKAQAQNLSLQNIATQFALSPEATSGDQQARVVANLIAGATGIELTSGADSLQGTGSNDLFVAGTYEQKGGGLASTLSASDTLTGNGGNDTLLVRGLTDSSPKNGVAPTLNNIQNLDVQGSTGSNGLDLQNAQGTTNVSLDSDKGLTLTLDNAGNVQNLSVGSSDRATVYVNDSAKTLNLALNNTSTTAQTFTLGTDNTQNVNVTATGSENLILEGKVNGSQVKNVTVSGSNASDAFTLTGANSTSLKDLTSSLKDLTSVDASNFAGSSTINVDTLKADGAANLATVTAGSGSSDEVISSSDNLKNVKVSGFEELGATSGPYDLKALNAAGNSISKVDVSHPTVDVSHPTDAVELDNAQSGLTVVSTSMAAQPQDLTVKNVYATTGNTLNLQVGDNATVKHGANLGTVNLDAGTTSVNIVSDLDQAGTAGVGTDGSQVYTNTIGDLKGNVPTDISNVGSVNVSGAGNLDVKNLEAGASALTIDASKATGQVTFGNIQGSTTGGDTFTAGSGGLNVTYNDIINDGKTDPTKVTNTFTGGAGNDTFTINDDTNNVLTGGAGVDTFDVTGLDVRLATEGTDGTVKIPATPAGTATFNYSSASDALVSVDARGNETGIETIKGFDTHHDKIDLSALGLNVSGGISLVDASKPSDASVFTNIADGTATATDLSSLKDLFTAGTGTTYLPPADGGTSSPSGNIAATIVNVNGSDLLFLNNAGSAGFDASKDSVISLSAPTTEASADQTHWAQALVLSK